MEWRSLFASSAVACLFVIANVLTERSLAAGRGWVMLVVCFTACVAFLGFRWCCSHYGLAVASSVVDSVLTIMTVGYAFIVLGERLSAAQCCGVVLLLAGLLLVNWPDAKQRDRVLTEGGVHRGLKSQVVAMPKGRCSLVGDDSSCRFR